ncbi:MAG: flagellar hook-length control protein FliK [Deltaproteobacteria bacterium]
MEPIILLPTSSQDLTTGKAPENPAPSEGDFDRVLMACQSSTTEKDVDQNSNVADPSILSVLLSMLQSPLEQNPVVSPEVFGGQPENPGNSAAPTPVLSNPIDPLIQRYYPSLSQVNEKDLLFPGEIVNQNERGGSPAVNPQNEGKGTSVVPGASALPEPPLETSPPIQDSLSPSPVSSSDQIKSILTAGTQAHQVMEPSNPFVPSPADTTNIQPDTNPSVPSPVDTGNIQSDTNPSGLSDPSNIFLGKNGTDPTVNGELLPLHETARKDDLLGGDLSPLLKGMADPAGKEKLKEILNTLFQGNKGSIDSNVKNWNGVDDITEQGAKDAPMRAEGDPAFQTGIITSKPLQGKSPIDKTVVHSSIGEEGSAPLLEELRGSEKTAVEAVEKDEGFPFSKKEVENGVEPSLILKPEGNLQAASSPNDVTRTREPALPRTEAPEILQQISKKLIWSVRNGEEKIKLQLEPPQLGSLYIEISRQKDVLQATVWTNNQVTKELLESHQVELQRILKQDGFHLGQFDVFVNQNMKSFQERAEGQLWNDRPAYASHGSHGPSSRDGTETLPAGTLPGTKGSRYIDLFI